MLLPKGNAPGRARGCVADGGLAGFVDRRWPATLSGQGRRVSRPLPKFRGSQPLGIEYHLAADGISLTLVLLTGLAAVAGILFSWNIEHRAKEFFAFYLALIGGVYGVFLSFDLFLLFVFYELAIIPKYFLIAIWGSTRKEYGAMKLALYSFVGSAMVLIGLIAAYVVAGAQDDEPGRTGAGSLSRSAFRCGLSRWCSWVSASWPASGPSTPGRRPATWRRRRPPRCCWPGW